MLKIRLRLQQCVRKSRNYVLASSKPVRITYCCIGNGHAPVWAGMGWHGLFRTDMHPHNSYAGRQWSSSRLVCASGVHSFAVALLSPARSGHAPHGLAWQQQRGRERRNETNDGSHGHGYAMSMFGMYSRFRACTESKLY